MGDGAAMTWGGRTAIKAHEKVSSRTLCGIIRLETACLGGGMPVKKRTRIRP